MGIRPAPLQDDTRCLWCDRPDAHGLVRGYCTACRLRKKRTGSYQLRRPPHWPEVLDPETVELDEETARKRAQIRMLLGGIG